MIGDQNSNLLSLGKISLPSYATLFLGTKSVYQVKSEGTQKQYIYNYKLYIYPYQPTYMMIFVSNLVYHDG